MLVGGFPCQTFSIIGKREGFDDPRGNLFFEIARIIRQATPRLLLLENVKGLLSHNQGHTFATIVRTLDELGYDVQWQVLNSQYFGVPQRRERVFIVGHRRDTPRPNVFPIRAYDAAGCKKERSLGRQVTSTLTRRYLGGGGSHIIESEAPLQIRRLTPLECERLQGFPDHWTQGIDTRRRYEVLGNAVTVPVVQAICKRILQ